MTRRSTAERVSHTIARLETEANIWLATATPGGDPHLVPLSLAWIDGTIVVATPSTTRTARNVVANGRGRATLDSADDVAIFDVTIEAIDYEAAAPSLTSAYTARVGWDPGAEHGNWLLLVLTITRGQAWNGPGEIAGRTIIEDGAWLAPIS